MDASCDRCRYSPATLAHTFWFCPNLSGFWSSIFSVFTQISGKPFESTPLTALPNSHSKCITHRRRLILLTPQWQILWSMAAFYLILGWPVVFIFYTSVLSSQFFIVNFSFTSIYLFIFFLFANRNKLIIISQILCTENQINKLVSTSVNGRNDLMTWQRLYSLWGCSETQWCFELSANVNMLTGSKGQCLKAVYHVYHVYHVRVANWQ